ncbi:AraC-like DNA-binding protein [Stackebrandtia endophytica]|uniref:AraC-like DNA-binding protein n=1 Tax=Stackebrandtia endophytica TaxID=1496996 RepID=A0A543B0Q5_9ACTN|nr:AraC family transcriptional regulator [Stackebrandtia endophytica]TQL78421.1 AraC-like DNA-binding protein [Stackebrandtia endophytica]
MDVLSDVISVMRTGHPRSARSAWGRPFGQRFAPGPGGAGFQVVLQGSCLLIPTDGEVRRLDPGDVVFFPHGGGHALADSLDTPLRGHTCDPEVDDRFEHRHGAPPIGNEPDDPAVVTLCGAYQLDSARTHPLLADLPAMIHLRSGMGQPATLRATVELLTTELTDPRLGADAIIPALLDTMLLYILRTWFDRAPSRVSGWNAALSDSAVTAALEAIHSEPERRWTVESLGAVANLSRAAFARRFSTLVGRSPLAYLTWWRMTLAARLLTDTDRPLSAVSTQVGYRSEFAFASAFKRQFGSPPGQYRRQR